MATPLLTLAVRRKRQLLLARSCARRLAGLAGLDAKAQTGLACGVFEMACVALERSGEVRLHFDLTGDTLQVRVLGAGPPALLQTRLAGPLPLAREDLAWAAAQLAWQASGNAFEEIRQQNRELLHALAELRRAEAPERTGLPAAA
jgi:hypothetical protein